MMEDSLGKTGVSIVVITFNHEKYIREALEGILNQKTTFNYEIIVHDDASTDATQSIISEYAKKHSEIVPILQKENQYSKGNNAIEKFILPKCKGKYLAFSEGDDRWVDNYKLQKQYEALENHPECSVCVHDVQTIDIKGNKQERMYPPKGFRLSSQAISAEEYFQFENYLFQTSSYFISKETFISSEEIRSKLSAYFNGDECFLRSTIVHGSIYYIADCMSEYRVGVAGSWSTKYKENEQKAYISLLKRAVQGNILLDRLTDSQFKKILIKETIRYLDILTYLDAQEAHHIYKENHSFLHEGVHELKFTKRLKYRILEFFPELIVKYMKEKRL